MKLKRIRKDPLLLKCYKIMNLKKVVLKLQRPKNHLSKRCLKSKNMKVKGKLQLKLMEENIIVVDNYQKNNMIK